MNRFEEGSYEDRLLKARQYMRAWVRYAIESSDASIARYNKLYDQHGHDDYEQQCSLLVREGKKKAEKIAANIDSMSLDDMDDFRARNRIPS